MAKDMRVHCTHSDMCEISETCEADELRVDCGQNNGELNENC